METVHFLIEPDEIDGGFIAKSMNAAITTQGDTEDELRTNIREAVLCHFDDAHLPAVIRLHFTKEESILLR